MSAVWFTAMPEVRSCGMQHTARGELTISGVWCNGQCVNHFHSNAQSRVYS